MPANIYVLVEHFKGQVADITHTLLAAARDLAQGMDGKVTAVLLGHGVRAYGQSLAADRVLLVDQPALHDFSPDAYLSALDSLIKKELPRVFLFGHTTVGMDVICGLGARHKIPVVSQCLKFRQDQDGVKFISQICGGKILAEGILPEPAAFVSVVPGGYKLEQNRMDLTQDIEIIELPPIETDRTLCLGYIEPDISDVDISKENILIAVGRGLENESDLELVEEFAQVMGATVVASRPIIDQDWLPISRLVGKSGKSVAPKLYLALGISGAPEHVEAIHGCELIIAVNTDLDAPIFNIAHYGTTLDLYDVLTSLTEAFAVMAGTKNK